MNANALRSAANWVARVAAIGLIVCISLFALDAFSQPNWPLALLMHLLPSFLLIIATVIAWRKSGVGGVLFVALGIGAMVITRLEAWIIYIPALLIGGLFLLKR